MGLYKEIYALRDDPSEYKKKPWLLRWSVQEIDENWIGETFGDYTWNEALARAGRQVLNEMGSCGTLGDSYSNYFDETLRKYYAYNVDGLQVMKFFSNKLVDTNFVGNSHRKAINWLLAQECIDKSLIRSLAPKEIGISCACAGDDSSDKNIGYNCYIAIANKVEARHITSHIPEF